MSERLSGSVRRRPRTPEADGFPPRRRRPIEAGESASEAVVAAVANAEDADATSLPPLDEHMDADHLNRLLDTGVAPTAVGLVFTRAEEINNDVEVSFQYAGYDVTVSENYVVIE